MTAKEREIHKAVNNIDDHNTLLLFHDNHLIKGLAQDIQTEIRKIKLALESE